MLHWRPFLCLAAVGLLSLIATVGGAVHWFALFASSGATSS
jgi:hypothetical protein